MTKKDFKETRDFKILSNPNYRWSSFHYVKNIKFTLELVDYFYDKINAEKINWWYLSHSVLTENIIEKYADKLSLDLISCKSILSEKFIEKFITKIDWNNLVWNPNVKLSNEFLDKYSNKLPWKNVNLYIHISIPEHILERHINDMNLDDFSEDGIGTGRQVVSEKFIEKYADKLNWSKMSDFINYNFSDEFLEKFKNKIDWSKYYYTHRDIADKYKKLAKAYVIDLVKESLLEQGNMCEHCVDKKINEIIKQTEDKPDFDIFKAFYFD